MKKITKSEKETFEFARDFARKLKGGETIGLVGDLGAGKTIFTKGLAKGLGVKQTITSPTFVLMKIYDVKSPSNSAGKQKSKVNCLCHIDAYRLRSENDLLALGVEEYFERDDSVVVIEWADKIKKILPQKAKLIQVSNKAESKRLINIL